MKSVFTAICLSLMLAGVVAAGQIGGITPEDIAAVWMFDEGSGDAFTDSEGQGIDGAINGAEWAAGSKGGALKFDGVDDGATVPDSAFINTTNGPWQNRTVMAMFKVDDATISDQKQTIFEEGGRTRGAVIYVFDDQVYVGMWNRAEYNWNGAWLSAPINSNEWYYAAFVLRDGNDAVEDDKFEFWLNGRLVDRAPGGQIYNHGDDTGIGYTNQNVVFHDDDGSGSDRDFFGGLIDEIRVYNAALSADDMGILAVSVEPADKMAAVWADLKQ